MLRIDYNNLLMSNDKDNKFIMVDNVPEDKYAKLLLKHVKCHSHDITVRDELCDLQSRCNWMIKGSRSDITLGICFEKLQPGCGFAIRIPRGRYRPDILLHDTLVKWFSHVLDFPLIKDGRAQLLLPPRACDLVRPARAQIVFNYDADDNDTAFFYRPSQFELYGSLLSKAVEEYTDLFHKLKDLNNPEPLPIIKDIEEEDKKPKKKSKKK